MTDRYIREYCDFTPQLYHEATIVNLLETVLFYKVCLTLYYGIW